MSFRVIRPSLNLERLVRDRIFKEPEQREAEINRRFLSLLPKENKGCLSVVLLYLGRSPYRTIEKEDIEQILREHNLLRDGADINSAVTEVLARVYVVPRGPLEERRYKFKQVANKGDREVYKLSREDYTLIPPPGLDIQRIEFPKRE